MTNEGWQTLSQVIAALGIVQPLVDVVLSARDSVWPKLKFGDSGAIIVYTGPKATPMIKFAEDSDLIIVRENGHLKV